MQFCESVIQFPSSCPKSHPCPPSSVLLDIFPIPSSLNLSIFFHHVSQLTLDDHSPIESPIPSCPYPRSPSSRHPSPAMNTRLATEADLDAMTWVLVGASPHDPVYPYRFPNLDGDEFAELCAQKCAEYLATSTVVVCEMPVGGDATRAQVVAFSAWDCPQPAPKVRSSGTFPSVAFF